MASVRVIRSRSRSGSGSGSALGSGSISAVLYSMSGSRRRTGDVVEVGNEQRTVCWSLGSVLRAQGAGAQGLEAEDPVLLNTIQYRVQ
jgi:hypothetical protein